MAIRRYPHPKLLLVILFAAGITEHLASAIRRASLPHPRSVRSFLDTVPATGSPADQCLAVSSLLTDRFSHTAQPARYGPTTDFPCWLLGVLGFEKFALIRDTDDLLGFAAGGWCDQVARAFADLGRMREIKTRVVQLDGHIVAEAWHDGGWHMYDPDYGIPSAEVSPLPSVGALCADPDPVRALYLNNRHGKDPKLLVDIFVNGVQRYAEPESFRQPLVRPLQRALRTASPILSVTLLSWFAIRQLASDLESPITARRSASSHKQ